MSRNVRCLVIGSKLSTDWTQTPLVETIKDALALQREGHAIAIISERRWLEGLAGSPTP
ncbi:hypothetical protein [Variovorax sp. GT1P44]|uniref:hypothetical protein n=1 Tax=Variovorax sp. GT1P44 TaxID=3443742 RepID=UPI003F44738A